MAAPGANGTRAYRLLTQIQLQHGWDVVAARAGRRAGRTDFAGPRRSAVTITGGRPTGQAHQRSRPARHGDAGARVVALDHVMDVLSDIGHDFREVELVHQ